MVVVHVTTVHPPYDARILRRECVSLANDFGAKVYLLNARGVDEEFHGVILKSVGFPRSRLLRFTWTMFKAYREAVQLNADLYHLHDPELLLLAKFLKARGSRVVFDCHENYVEKIKAKHWIPEIARGAMSKFYDLASNYIVPRLDGVIGATEEIVSSVRANRTAVVRNLPSTKQIECNADFGNRDPELILYTGGLTGLRGIEQVCEGLIYYCNVPWKLIIVGRENRKAAKRMRPYLDDDRIEYKGIVSFENVVKLMQKAALGVVCNQAMFDYQNALPNKLFEYMAAGLPVICSAFPRWVEIVEKNGAGITCDAANPKCIGQTCEALLQDSERRCLMGQRARTLVENQFCWELEYDSLEKFYRDCLNGDVV